MIASSLTYLDTLPLHPQPEPLESLTSYLTRLIEANQLRLRQTLLKLCSPPGRSKMTIYTGDYPPVSFGALPEVACCPEPELLSLTFYHLGKKFDRLLKPWSLAQFLSESIAPHLRYCPHCLVERAYYALTWRFLEITGCPDHQCQLLDRCGHCGETVPLLPPTPKLGMCPTCGEDLRTCQTERLDEARLQTVRARCGDFAYLLSPQPCETRGERITGMIGEQFANWRQVRQLRIVDAARYLERSPSIIYYIEAGPQHRGVKLQWYVKYADFLQVRLQDIFEAVLPCPSILTHEEKLVNKVQQAIVILEQQEAPITQQAVAQMIGVGGRSIFTTYPQIRNLWAEHKAKWRRQRENELVNQVQQAIDCLKQQGKPVSQRAVSKMVGLSWTSLQRSYPTAWAVLKQQSDYGSATRKNGNHNQVRSTYQREDELVNQVRQAIDSLRQQGKAISQQAISKIVGLTPTGLRYYPRVKTILQAHKGKNLPQDEDELLGKVQAALISLESAGVMVSKKAVSNILGLTSGALEYYPRVRAFVAAQITEKQPEHRAKQRQRREEELVTRVQQAIELLTSGGRPVTQTAICEIVQMSSASLKRYPRVRLLLVQGGLVRSPA